MVLLMSRPWKNPDTGVYYIRRKVHPNLKPFMGCSEYKRSLETKDPEEALSRFPDALAESNAAFALARKAQEGHVELNAGDAKQLAARWFTAETKRLEASGDWSRWLVIGTGIEGAEAYTLSFILAEYEDLEGWNKTYVLPVVAQVLKDHNHAMPPRGSALLRQLVEVFTAHILDLSRWALDNWLKAGRYVPLPQVMPYAPTSVEAKKEEEANTRKEGEAVDIVHAPASWVFLRDVLDDWVKHGKAGGKAYPVKTVAKYTLAVSRFEALSNNPSMATIDRVAGTAFRRAMLAQEGDNALTPATVRDTLVNVGSLLNHYSKQTGRLSFGIWQKLSAGIVEETVDSSRDEWTEDELKKLFGLPIWQSYAIPSGKNASQDAAYWVPLLGLCTGARVTELCQLRVDDFTELDGVWFLRMAVTDKKQSLKRKDSWRTIPLPRLLIDLGLLDYRNDIQALGQQWLFPGVNFDSQNNAGGGVSKWFSSLKIDQGFRSEVVFHSFRNSLNTRLLRLGVGIEFRCKYVGQKPEGGVNVDNYNKLKERDLVSVAEVIDFPFLSLPKVYKSPSWRPGWKESDSQSQGAP